MKNPGQREKNDLKKNCKIIYNRVLDKKEDDVPILDEYPIEV